MSYFLALRLADDAREQLARVASRMQAWDLPARWVHPDDYHMTVAFLGQLDATEANAIPWAVADVARAVTPPRLHLAGLGAFAGRTEPRVVYAAVADPDDWCQDLHHDLQDALGEQPEQRFHPHVTLCRPRNGSPQLSAATEGRSWRRLLEAYGQAQWGSCAVTGLVFYQSVDAPPGQPRYRALEEWPLLDAA